MRWRSDDRLDMSADNECGGTRKRTLFSLRHDPVGWRVVGPADRQPAPGRPVAFQPAPGKPVAFQPVDLLGGWRLTAYGETCQLFLTVTAWPGGYRAATRQCTNARLQSIQAYSSAGGQVTFKDGSGSTIATLRSTGVETFAGTTPDREPVSIGR